ncbi:MAG: hypothetical protein M1816_008158 [Peltula sp. TS41687]|nr:MAG: hypothetical protein M1816_008158 [Peltula sp. TS41687]
MKSTLRPLQRSIRRATSSDLGLPRPCYLCTLQARWPNPRVVVAGPIYGKAGRAIHTTAPLSASRPPASRDRGPPSQEETQTDFSKLDVLSDVPAPTTAIDVCLPDGFQLDNGLRITGGGGCLLVNGEALEWRPWEAGGGRGLVNDVGQWECDDQAWGVLDLVWPKPDLLILGQGPSIRPLSPATRAYLNRLGFRIEVQDTRNASAQFNMLATERGVGDVAAALVPIGRMER